MHAARSVRWDGPCLSRAVKPLPTNRSYQRASHSKTLTVKHTYSLAPCEGPAGIAMDTAHRRIFSGCADNNMMAITNADTGKVIATPPIGEDTDASAFDAATGL